MVSTFILIQTAVLRKRTASLFLDWRQVVITIHKIQDVMRDLMEMVTWVIYLHYLLTLRVTLLSPFLLRG